MISLVLVLFFVLQVPIFVWYPSSFSFFVLILFFLFFSSCLSSKINQIFFFHKSKSLVWYQSSCSCSVLPVNKNELDGITEHWRPFNFYWMGLKEQDEWGGKDVSRGILSAFIHFFQYVFMQFCLFFSNKMNFIPWTWHH